MGEYATISLTSPRGPGRWMRLLYRLPVWLHQRRLDALIPAGTLLLTTRGRVSGRDRTVALSFEHDPDEDVYYVVAGWGSRAHWYRNLEAEPRVRLYAAGRSAAALAAHAPDDVVLALYRHTFEQNPFAGRTFAQLTGAPVEATDAGLRDLARRCPVVALHVAES